MAVVSISEHKVVGFAAWALDALMRGVLPFLPADSAAAEVVRRAQESRIEFLPFEEMKPSDYRILADGLSGYLDWLREHGSVGWQSPEAFPSYVEGVEEVLALVEGEAAPTE